MRGRIQTQAESFLITSVLFYLLLRQDDPLPALLTGVWWETPFIPKEGRKRGGRENGKERGRKEKKEEGKKKEKHKLNLSSEFCWFLCNSISIYWLPDLPPYARHWEALIGHCEGVFVFTASLSSLRICFWKGHLFEPEDLSSYPGLGPVWAYKSTIYSRLRTLSAKKTSLAGMGTAWIKNRLHLTFTQNSSLSIFFMGILIKTHLGKWGDFLFLLKQFENSWGSLRPFPAPGRNITPTEWESNCSRPKYW